MEIIYLFLAFAFTAFTAMAITLFIAAFMFERELDQFDEEN
jgi:hypothetical protein